MKKESCLLALLLVVSSCMFSDLDDYRLENDFSITINDSAPVDTILPGGIGLIKKDGLYYWQGDMIFLDSTLYRLLPPDRSGIRNDAQYYWPYRKVYYYFPPYCYPTFVNAVSAAMDAISAVSSVSFFPKMTSTNNYIRFEPFSANGSLVGMQGGEQIVYLCDYMDIGKVIHEIMHSLGFIHEMCRPDRDSYLEMNWDNIQPNMQSHYGTIFTYPTTVIGSLDYNSIMMYNSYINDTSIVSDPNEPMFLKLDGTPVYANRDTLSAGDIEGIKAIYGPPFHRLETQLRVVDEYCYGVDDYIEMEILDKVLFYADETCTQRQALSYPRKLNIKKTTQECHGYGNSVETYYDYYTINVPAGVDSVMIDYHTDIEYYINSNPYEISLITYQIINCHVNNHMYDMP